MNTEITDKIERGWVLYDGACSICKSLVARWGAALERRGFTCVPLQTDWVRERLNLSEHELMLEMRVLEPSEKVIGGAAALLSIARTFWWALPLVWLAKVPCVFRWLDAAYRWGAARRYCVNGSCAIDTAPRAIKPLTTSFKAFILLPLGVLFLIGKVPPWLFMWTMAAALWLALKLFTFADAPSKPFGRSLAYLFAWPGMDARNFFTKVEVHRPVSREWFFAVLNVCLGTTLIYGAARLAYADSPLSAGWIAMIGTVLGLHFGIFKCLALLWRGLGIPAIAIMDAPLRSRSLSEFWGRRWNTGFSIPARHYLMEPIARRFGTIPGLFAVFLVSGIVHELVISLPANAGYGLPTLYFLIQAAGLIIERKIGANRGVTLLCVSLPAFVLFHPPFVHKVMIPFLKVIGAL